MDEHLDIWDHHYYKITKTILRVLGYWPYQSRSEFLICRAVLFFLYFIHMTPQVFAAVHWHNNVDLVTEVASCLIVDCCVIASIVTFHYHFDKMEVLLNQIRVDWTIFPENNGRHMLYESMEQGRKFAVLHSGALFSAAAIFVTEPVYLRVFHFSVGSNDTSLLRFAIPVYYGSLDTDKYYWYILILTGICILLLVAAIVAIDVLLFVYGQHLCGIFEALGFAIDNLPVNEKSSECDDDYAYTYVKKCVLIHRRAIGFANSLDDIYTWNLFIMLGLNMLGISLTAAQTVIHQDEIVKLVKTSLFSLSEIIHLFVQCYMAQRVADSSLLIQQNLMHTRWYHSTPRVKQSLHFMMMRSQIPCHLTAGKMIPLSLNLYCTILRTSGTYFTLLLDTQ